MSRFHCHWYLMKRNGKFGCSIDSCGLLNYSQKHTHATMKLARRLFWPCFLNASVIVLVNSFAVSLHIQKITNYFIACMLGMNMLRKMLYQTMKHAQIHFDWGAPLFHFGETEVNVLLIHHNEHNTPKFLKCSQKYNYPVTSIENKNKSFSASKNPEFWVSYLDIKLKSFESIKLFSIATIVSKQCHKNFTTGCKTPRLINVLRQLIFNMDRM